MNGKDLLFIVGCPRSGTTWLQKILSTHEKIVTAQESHIFPSFISPILKTYYSQLLNPSERGGTGLPCYFNEKQIIQEMREFFFKMIKNVTDYNEGVFFLEKTPSNALYLDDIFKVLPESKIIHIIRDPRDVIASLIDASKTWGKVWAPKNIEDASIMWKNHVNSAENSLNKFPIEQQITIKYEHLVENTHKILEDIFLFLKVKIDENSLYQLIDNSNNTELMKYGEYSKNSSGIICQEPNGFAKKNFSKHFIEKLSANEVTLINTLLADEIERFNYSL